MMTFRLSPLLDRVGCRQHPALGPSVLLFLTQDDAVPSCLDYDMQVRIRSGLSYRR